MRIRVLLAMAPVLAVFLVMVAVPAGAVKWRSAANPLIGYDGGTKFGRIHGRFANDGHVRATSTTWHSDLRPGGNKVRAETDFYFWEWDTLCSNGGGGSCWRFDVSKQTPTTNSRAWLKHMRARNLHPFASRVRGGVNVCEIKRFWNDPCSSHAWPSFSY